MSTLLIVFSDRIHDDCVSRDRIDPDGAADRFDTGVDTDRFDADSLLIYGRLFRSIYQLGA